MDRIGSEKGKERKKLDWIGLDRKGKERKGSMHEKEQEDEGNKKVIGKRKERDKRKGKGEECE